jgi:hypothetical protein
MRRRLRRFFPIVLLALVVQILAPIAACWAASIAASDPLAMPAICHDSGGVGNQTSNQADQTRHHAHDGACALCCVAQLGSALDTSDTTVATPYRHPLRMVWRDVAPELRAAGVGGHAQARAPPSFS